VDDARTPGRFFSTQAKPPLRQGEGRSQSERPSLLEKTTAASEGNIDLVGPTYYLSHLELALNSGVGRYASVFQNLGPQITSLLGSYNVPVRDLRASSIS
jgi:hypothetical protein